MEPASTPVANRRGRGHRNKVKRNRFTPSSTRTPGAATKRSDFRRTPLLNVSSPNVVPNQLAPPQCHQDDQRAHDSQSTSRHFPESSRRLQFIQGNSNEDLPALPASPNPVVASLPTRQPDPPVPEPSPVLLSSTVKKDSLKYLFLLIEKDSKLQKDWWPLKALVDRINRLNRLSKDSWLLMHATSAYKDVTIRAILTALRNDCQSMLTRLTLLCILETKKFRRILTPRQNLSWSNWFIRREPCQ